MNVQLANAVERSEQSANFNLPDHNTRASIPVGHYAKVCANGERFWVEVTGNDKGSYTGRIANNLFNTENHGLSRGDPISFDACHVFDITD